MFTWCTQAGLVPLVILCFASSTARCSAPRYSIRKAGSKSSFPPCRRFEERKVVMVEKKHASRSTNAITQAFKFYSTNARVIARARAFLESMIYCPAEAREAPPSRSSALEPTRALPVIVERLVPGFAAALIPRLFGNSTDPRPRHHRDKHANAGRVRTGRVTSMQMHPAVRVGSRFELATNGIQFCLCQLGQGFLVNLNDSKWRTFQFSITDSRISSFKPRSTPGPDGRWGLAPSPAYESGPGWPSNYGGRPGRCRRRPVTVRVRVRVRARGPVS